MRGHEAVIRMREEGKKPIFVFLDDYPCDTDWFETGFHANVCVDGDDIQSLDLRFLVGLSVSVSSHDESRAKALFEACKAVDVDRMAACHIKPELPAGRQDGWVGTWSREVAHG